jgi:hypothetical protein
MSVSPATHSWIFPPARSGRVSLRALMADEARLEHHLIVVARVGGAVVECATASEPLAFAHRNISDEYAVMLPTGDPLLDSCSARTFIGTDEAPEAGRVKHGVGDLVLHPHGFVHWPGKLRPPFTPMRFAPGMRRRGLTLVVCAAAPCPPGARPLGATPGREGDVKADAPLPLLLCDTRRAAAGPVGAVADARLELVHGPGAPAGPGVLVDLDSAELLELPAAWEGTRGLAIRGPDAALAPPPASPPFALFEDAAATALPMAVGPVVVEAVDDATVRIGAALVPRHWLARLLFRVPLHGYRLGRVETYGGFFCDDSDAAGVTLGVRGGPVTTVPRAHASAVLEALYRAVAPPGYREQPPA